MSEDNAVYLSPIVEFQELKDGKIFKYIKEEDYNPDNIFRKVSPYQKLRVISSLPFCFCILVNAICLNDGSTREIFDREMIQPVIDPFLKGER